MTSLMEDIKTYYEDENYPPDGPDLDYELVGGELVKKDTETVKVFYGVIDDTPRWGDVIQVVYKRSSPVLIGDEYVAVQDVRPATEMQDWGDYGKPEIYEVKPVKVTITKYEKV